MCNAIRCTCIRLHEGESITAKLLVPIFLTYIRTYMGKEHGNSHAELYCIHTAQIYKAITAHMVCYYNET